MLVADIAVSCFLKGGNLLDMMAAACEYRNIDEMVRDTSREFSRYEDSIKRQRDSEAGNKRGRDELESMSSNKGVPDQLIDRMEEAFKSAKIRSTYSGQWKKFKQFG